MIKLWDAFSDLMDQYLDRKILAHDAVKYENYVGSRKIDGDGKSTIRAHINAIEANIATALTHISAMIAALGVLLIAFQDSKITQVFMAIELMIYTLLAILCLLIIRYRRVMPGLVEDMDQRIRNEYQHYLRIRYVFQAICNVLIINTALFLLTILLHTLSFAFH